MARCRRSCAGVRRQPASRRRRHQRRRHPEGRSTTPASSAPATRSRSCAWSAAAPMTRTSCDRRRRHRRLRLRVRAGEGRRDASRCSSTARPACRRPTPPPACSRRSSSPSGPGPMLALRPARARASTRRWSPSWRPPAASTSSIARRHPQGRVRRRPMPPCCAPLRAGSASSASRSSGSTRALVPRAGAAAHARASSAASSPPRGQRQQPAPRAGARARRAAHRGADIRNAHAGHRLHDARRPRHRTSRSGDESFACDTVVLAAGARSGQIARKLRARSPGAPDPRPDDRARRHARRRSGTSSGAPTATSCRAPTASSSPAPRSRTSASVAARRRPASRRMRAMAIALVPQLAAAKQHFEWAGLRPGTPDDLPDHRPAAGDRERHRRHRPLPQRHPARPAHRQARRARDHVRRLVRRAARVQRRARYVSLRARIPLRAALATTLSTGRRGRVDACQHGYEIGLFIHILGVATLAGAIALGFATFSMMRRASHGAGGARLGRRSAASSASTTWPPPRRWSSFSRASYLVNKLEPRAGATVGSCGPLHRADRGHSRRLLCGHAANEGDRHGRGTRAGRPRHGGHYGQALRPRRSSA